jgi:uncharacterized Tic20 family protein
VSQNPVPEHQAPQPAPQLDKGQAPQAPHPQPGYQQPGYQQPGHQQGGYQQGGYQPAPGTSGDERTMAVLAHLSAPIAAVISVGWLSMVGPLVVWALYKDKDPVVRQAAAGAFNFNLAFWLVYLVSWILILTVVGAVVGLPLLVVGFVVAAVCHVIGAVRASRGEPYRYPFQIPVLR